MHKLMRYIKGYEKQAVLAPLFKMLEATFELFVPLVVASIIDTGIKNESQEEELRIAAAETLGWYNLYHDKTSIIKELETFQTSKKKVMNEIVKTINRLKGKNR